MSSGSNTLFLASKALPDDPETTLKAYADNIVRHRPPTGDQIDRHQNLRAAASDMILALLKNCPPSPDRTTAIHRVREAMMRGSASIAMET